MQSLLYLDIEKFDWSQSIALIEQGRDYNERLANLAFVETPKLTQSLKEFLTSLKDEWIQEIPQNIRAKATHETLSPMSNDGPYFDSLL